MTVMHCLTTNPQPQNDRFTGLLRARGIGVTQLPLHAYGPPSAGGAALRQVLREAQADAFDWLLFSSPQAVAAVVAEATLFPNAAQYGAVGEATAAALRAAGVEPAVVANGGGEALATAVLQHGLTASTRIASFQAEAGRTEWHTVLTAHGATLRHVPAYRLLPSPVDAAAWCAAHPDPIHAIPFTAPSAVQRFVELFSPFLAASPFATARYYAIGRTTATALTVAQLPIAAVASSQAFSALVAVIEHENS
ncbi:MAG: uroporphyrinogen-III synthase [Deltaproteobacteria bacterium]|nr:uroporphyrinogen-III synthase [Deltaproteobacteria bacterium]